MPETIDVALISLTAASPTSQTLKLAWQLLFRPGQAVKIQLPGEEKNRYFSISSSPTEKGFVEITVKCDPHSPMSSTLAALRPGVFLKVSGPYGSFGLPAKTDQPLCFIAAGSGVTPFRSMIKYLIDGNRLPESWVFHSARSKEDFIFQEQFTQWEALHPKLHHIPTLTQKIDPDWEYETGRITEKLLRKHIELEAHCFLLCGPPPFVSDMEKLLQSLGIGADQILREQW